MNVHSSSVLCYIKVCFYVAVVCILSHQSIWNSNDKCSTADATIGEISQGIQICQFVAAVNKNIIYFRYKVC